jgi:sugar phosphate isomerase/epimerase
MDLYKQYFEKMNLLGAKIFVVHGAIASAKCSDERYVERFRNLVLAGQEQGIIVAQENVCYCKSAKLDFLQYLKRELGDMAAFVLDLKQARRSGVDAVEIVETLEDSIVHLHFSDGVHCDSKRDCLLIGEGDFDFTALFTKLRSVGYKGGAVVELYRENYREFSQLADCVGFLEKML